LVEGTISPCRISRWVSDRDKSANLANGVTVSVHSGVFLNSKSMHDGTLGPACTPPVAINIVARLLALLVLETVVLFSARSCIMLGPLWRHES
jgi:hypothetical protein